MKWGCFVLWTYVCAALWTILLVIVLFVSNQKGRGIGGHVAKKFAQEGFFAALVRRSNQKYLDEQVETIREEGGEAEGFLVDATDQSQVPIGPS